MLGHPGSRDNQDGVPLGGPQSPESLRTYIYKMGLVAAVSREGNTAWKPLGMRVRSIHHLGLSTLLGFLENAENETEQ